MRNYLGYSLSVLFILILLNSCSDKKETTITVIENSTAYDTLYINQLMTDVPLGKLAIGTPHSIILSAESPQIAVAKTKEKDNATLLVYENGEQKELVIDSLGIHSNSLADSLLSYLHTSSNQTLVEYGYLLSNEEDREQLLQVFDSLLIARNSLIESKQLSIETKKLLSYQNKSRIYNFLFFYGRMMQNLGPTNSFFDFINNIQYDDPYFRTSPQVLLYKMEIEYLRKNEAITSINNFNNYIDSVVTNKDDAAFLRAFYMKQLIESPQYWEKHQKVFNSIELKSFQKREINNPYAYLYSEGSKSYFSALEGNKAEDFIAYRPDSSTLQLASLKKKLIIIDAWATWCEPCIEQKPYFEKVAEEFKDKEVVFLSISTDTNYSKWRKYINRKGTHPNITELFLGDQLTAFKKNYNVQSIPRYIFIDPSGHIIDADMEDPGEGMRKRIESKL